MALELEIDKLETAPEALRQYYKPHNGKLRLDVSGVEDVSGLKSALARNKAENQDIKKALQEHGLSAADIPTLVDSRKALTEARAARDAAEINHALDVMLIRSRVTGSGMELLPLMLRQRLSIESVDGKRIFRITDADGRPMAGSLPGGLANFDDLAKAPGRRLPALIQGTGAGGGGASRRGSRSNGLPPETILLSEFDKMDPTTRHTKIVKEGWSVVD